MSKNDDALDELDEIRADANDNVEGLKRKNRQLLGELKKLKDRLAGRPPEPTTPREIFLRDAERRLLGLKGEAHKAEMAKLQEEIVPLVDAEIAEHRKQQEERLERQRGTITRLMRQHAADDLAMRIRKPGIQLHVLTPLFIDRFDVQEQDGEFTVITKGPTGQPVSIDALADELRQMPALAPLIAGASADEKAAHQRRVAETLGRKS